MCIFSSHSPLLFNQPHQIWFGHRLLMDIEWLILHLLALFMDMKPDTTSYV